MKFAFDPLEWTDRIAPFVRRVPVPVPGSLDEPLRCLKVNDEWASYLMTAISILNHHSVWRDISDDALYWINTQVMEIITQLGKDCEECEECEDCPEPEPPAQPPPSSGGGSGGGYCEIGESGLTARQLEAILSMSIVDIRWNAGKLEVKRFGCCDWESVGGLPNLITLQTGKPVDLVSVGEWEATPEIAIPDVPSVPHGNPEYEDDQDAIRCAKATAMMIALDEALENISLALAGVSGISGGTAGALALTLVTSMPSMGLSTAMFLVSVALPTLIGLTGSQASGQIDDSKDEATQTTVICKTTIRLSQGETVTSDDITVLFDQFRQANAESDDWWILKVIEAIPMFLWKQWMQPKVAETECGCIAYLPRGLDLSQPIPGTHIFLNNYGITPQFSVIQDKGYIQGTELHSLTNPSNTGFRNADCIIDIPDGVTVTAARFHIQWTQPSQYQAESPDIEIELINSSAVMFQEFTFLNRGGQDGNAPAVPLVYSTGTFDPQLLVGGAIRLKTQVTQGAISGVDIWVTRIEVDYQAESDPFV